MLKWSLLIMAAMLAYFSGYIVGQNIKNKQNKEEPTILNSNS